MIMAEELADPPRCWPLGEELSERKTGRYLLTDEQLAQVRKNVEQFDWAAGAVRAAVGGGDRWVNESDEHLASLVPPTDKVPRACYVNQMKGCPVHGTEIKKHDSFHPWRMDPKNHPYKMICPVGGEMYPSNDFASGDLTSGEYPDDGHGWTAPDGTKYCFLGEYAHFVYLDYAVPAASQLAAAYLYTGNQRYAHKSAVILFRAAQEYKHLSVHLDDRNNLAGGHRVMHPTEKDLQRTGMITDQIWTNERVGTLAEAYDSIFPGLEGDDELVAFCSKLEPEIKSIDDLRAFFEKWYLRVAAQGLIDESILGNDGMHQRAMMTVAAVLGYERSRDLVDWVYYGPGQMAHHPVNYFFKDGAPYEGTSLYNTIHVVDMIGSIEHMEPLRRLHPELYPEDRYPDIFATSKFKQILDFSVDVVMMESTYPWIGDTGASPYWWKLGRNLTNNRRRELYLDMFRRYKTARYAKVLHGPDGRIPTPPLYMPPPHEEIKTIIAEQGTDIVRGSSLQDGYGLALVRRAENTPQQRDISLLYGQPRGHAHDQLFDVAVYAMNRILVNQLGYPRSWHFANNWEKNWATHWKVGVSGPSHVDTLKGEIAQFSTGHTAALCDAWGRAWSCADDDDGLYALHPDETYRRAVVMLDLNESASCLVDIWRIRMGSEHYYAFHGFEGGVQTTGIEDWEVQQQGTLAGPDVAYAEREKVKDAAKSAWAFLHDVRRGTPSGQFSADWELGEDPSVHVRLTVQQQQGTLAGPDVAYAEREKVKDAAKSAWAFLHDVRRGTPSGQFSANSELAEDPDVHAADWEVADNPDVHMRLTMLQPANAELIMAKGHSPSGGHPYELDFLLSKSVGEAPHTTQYVSVLEPYAQASLIDSIEALPTTDTGADFDPVALRITSGDAEHYVLYTGEVDGRVDVTGGPSLVGRCAVATVRGGQVESLFLAGAASFEFGQLRVTLPAAEQRAQIVEVDYDANQVIVVPALEEASALVGHYAHIGDDDHQCRYRIEQAEPAGDGRMRLTFNINAAIGEGVANEFADSFVRTAAIMPMSGRLYYYGKHIVNDDGSAHYRVTRVHDGGNNIQLVPGEAQSAAELEAAFGTGAHFTIYDYGVGDELVVPSCVSVCQRNGNVYEVHTNAVAQLSVPR